MDIILHLTHSCQLRCAYCYSGDRRKGHMPWEVARLALDLFFIKNSTGHDMAPQICFFGGEPLLEYELIKKCIDYAESQKSETCRCSSFALNTNGLGLDKNIANYLQSKHVNTILSFDGVREAQDASRLYSDGSSSFGETEKALQVISEHMQNPIVCAVVTPKNVEFLPESVDFFLDHGVQRLFLNPNFFAVWDEQHLDLLVKGYQHAAARFEQSYRQGIPLNINLFTNKIVTHLRRGLNPCEYGDLGEIQQLAIAPSGRIYYCQYMVRDDENDIGLLGNVFDGLDSELTSIMMEHLARRDPECQECKIKQRCRKWYLYLGNALAENGNDPYGFVCFHEQMVVQLADKIATRLFEERNETFIQTFYSEMRSAGNLTEFNQWDRIFLM